MTGSELATRLDQLNAHIDAAQKRLKLKGLLSADHQIKASELRDRYKALSRKVHDENGGCRGAWASCWRSGSFRCGNGWTVLKSTWTRRYDYEKAPKSGGTAV